MVKVNPTKKSKIPSPEENYPIYREIYNESSMQDALSNSDFIDSDWDIEIEINKGKFCNLEFNTTPLAGCCGILEIRNLSTSGNSLNSTHINHILDGILSNITTKDRCRTLMINTNGSTFCQKWDTALAINPNFTLVKTFKNSNSGNIIKV